MQREGQGAAWSFIVFSFRVQKGHSYGLKEMRGYSRSGDYVSQTTAAHRDHSKRQSALDEKMEKELSDRMERLFGESTSRREGYDDWEPDRPREAPGGGRTRSR